MNTPNQTLTSKIQLVDTGEKFQMVRAGISSYLSGVNKTIGGLRVLSLAGSTSLGHNLLSDDQYLDVHIPASFILNTENNSEILIPNSTWIISQSVDFIPVPDIGQDDIISSGLQFVADFDRNYIDDIPEERKLFEKADIAFGNSDHKIYSISVNAFEMMHALFHPGKYEPATLTGLFPTKSTYTVAEDI